MGKPNVAATGCNAASNAWTGTIDGRPYWLNYGWPDSGDALNGGQIDSQIDYSGFQASIVSTAETLFVRPDAPTPAYSFDCANVPAEATRVCKLNVAPATRMCSFSPSIQTG